MKNFLAFFFCLILCSCTIYTERRSEALSQSVFATSDSIVYARFDLAAKYSKEAEKLAFPPKKRIQINPVYTSVKSSRSGSESTSATKVEDAFSVIRVMKEEYVVPSKAFEDEDQNLVLRMVVPEHLKHAKLLIENSDEWNYLLETKQFSIKLKEDYSNLQKLSDEVNKELQKQTEMNSRMISDLKDMQRKLAQKELAILRRNIVIVGLIAAIGGGVYLRMKGVL